jgi:site-specific recombinase XerD
VLKNAGIKERYGIHALRHTFASMLFSKGVDVKIVSKLLGHSSVKITYDTYVHLFENDIKCVTCVLD